MRGSAGTIPRSNLEEQPARFIVGLEVNRKLSFAANMAAALRDVDQQRSRRALNLFTARDFRLVGLLLDVTVNVRQMANFLPRRCPERLSGSWVAILETTLFAFDALPDLKHSNAAAFLIGSATITQRCFLIKEWVGDVGRELQ